jgi:tRNA threonylcarbamoyladenosine biosynthesis protein TsaE
MGGLEFQIVSNSEADTKAIGATLAELLTPGSIVGLTGDLGAGKTRLVQGAVAALGSDDPVVSPTFMLVRECDAEVPVHHVDAYRLSGPAELEDIGLDNVLDPAAIVFVEWAGTVEAALSGGWLEIRIDTVGDTGRVMTVLPHDGPWPARMGELKAALAAFQGDSLGDRPVSGTGRTGSGQPGSS